jgi:hypothetical protein
MSPTTRTALLLALLTTVPLPAHAAPPAKAAKPAPPATAPLDADLSSPYRDRPEVDHARRVGLDAATLALLEDPATPSDLRVALIHAADSRRPKNKSHAQVFARHLARQLGKDRMTLARLGVPELLTLGYMTALEAPTTLKRPGGKTEVERAPAHVLLTAAVNRNRGDLTIALIDAQLKAQLAYHDPDNALCEPHVCIDQVLENYPDEWSMRPASVCALVAATPRPANAQDGAGARLCAAFEAGEARAPVYAEGGISPSDQGALPGRFSSHTPASPWAALGTGQGIPTGGQGGPPPSQMLRALLPPPSSPEEALLFEMLLRELDAQAQQLPPGAMILPHSMIPPGLLPPRLAPQRMPAAQPHQHASPQTIELDGPQPDGTLPVDAGDGPAPQDSSILIN